MPKKKIVPVEKAKKKHAGPFDNKIGGFFKDTTQHSKGTSKVMGKKKNEGGVPHIGPSDSKGSVKWQLPKGKAGKKK